MHHGGEKGKSMWATDVLICLTIKRKVTGLIRASLHIRLTVLMVAAEVNEIELKF